MPAPVCRYGLNDTARTFDAAGALGGVDMRVAAGCAWTAQSDAPWLTITSGSAGTGDGAINFAVAANPGLGQRVGTITAAGASFTVTQNGLSCAYTVTPPATTAFPTAGGSGTVRRGDAGGVRLGRDVGRAVDHHHGAGRRDGPWQRGLHGGGQ